MCKSWGKVVYRTRTTMWSNKDIPTYFRNEYFMCSVFHSSFPSFCTAISHVILAISSLLRTGFSAVSTPPTITTNI